MPNVSLAPHTTQAELDQIKQVFGNDFEAIDQAIETGATGNFSVEDLIDYRIRYSGELPEVLQQATEGALPDPDSKPWLWQSDEIDTYEFWRNQEGASGPLNQLIAWIESEGLSPDVPAEDKGILDEIGSTVEEWMERDKQTGNKGDKEDATDDVLNLFDVEDLDQFMTMLMATGNPGMALLFYISYLMLPSVEEARDEAIFTLEEAREEMATLNEDLASAIEMDSPEGSAEAERIRSNLNTISAIVETMSQFLQTLESMLDDMIETASNMQSKASRTTSVLSGNIG